MLGKSPNRDQKHLFMPDLVEFINPKHELYLLAEAIDWQQFETDLAEFYSNLGAPAKPIRLMVGLLILKQLYHLGDETVMAQWVSNPYFQYFCGESVFQWKFPCDPSDLVHFRHRIGEAGVEKILAASILLHGKKVLSEDISIDTTVQEKNITFPTDTKLAVKVIKKCQAIAKKEVLKLRQSYKFVVKDLLKKANSRSPKKAAERKKARKSIKTKAGVLVREVRRKLSAESLAKHEARLKVCEKVLNQKREDKNKIYALHELEVSCIAKGKVEKKYEFGSKVSLAVSQKSNVIVSVVNFKGNPNDNQTLEKTLEKQEKLTGVRAKNAYGPGLQNPKDRRDKGSSPNQRCRKNKDGKDKIEKEFSAKSGNRTNHRTHKVRLWNEEKLSEG